jgi:hypothetical protein
LFEKDKEGVALATIIQALNEFYFNDVGHSEPSLQGLFIAPDFPSKPPLIYAMVEDGHKKARMRGLGR